jgi:transposase
MDGSIELTADERKMLLKSYRAGTDSRTARRAHIVLLRAHGLTWERIRSLLYCSNDLIADTLRAWAAGGVTAIVEQVSAPTPIPAWLLKVLNWVSRRTPQDFGFFRSRWSCACLSLQLRESGWKVSAETIRRGLRRLGFVWRRPRPIVGPTDPEYD